MQNTLWVGLDHFFFILFNFSFRSLTFCQNFRQYPWGGVGGQYPPGVGGGFPGGYPPQQPGAGGYPPQQGGAGGYPPQQPIGGYPPQQGGAGGQWWQQPQQPVTHPTHPPFITHPPSQPTQPPAYPTQPPAYPTQPPAQTPGPPQTAPVVVEETGNKHIDSPP